MNARISGLIGVMAALAAACKSDPTATGVGTPVAVLANFSSLTLNNGQATTFTAQVVDSRLTALPVGITFTSCDPTVVTVSNDPTYHPVPATSQRAVVTAVGLNKVCIIASSSGVKPDTVFVTSLPVLFPGTFSKTNFTSNDTVTISGTSLFGFDPATVALTYPTVAEPLALPITSATATAVSFIGGKFDGTQAWSIGGVTVNYAGITVSLPTVAGALTFSGGAYAGDSLPATAPDISGWLTALPVDSTATSLLLFPQAVNPNAAFCWEGTGPCSFLRFTLAAPTTLTILSDWDGDNGANPDVDIYICAGTSTTVNLATCGTAANGGSGGAAANKPEKIAKHTYAAGTYYFVAEYFAACDGASCPDAAGAVNNLQLEVTKQ